MGSHFEATAAEQGELSLANNDSFYNDNTGYYEVCLTASGGPWRTTGNLTSCDGPIDSLGHSWFEADFDDGQWVSIQLPDENWGCSNCDRFYRYAFDMQDVPDSVFLSVSSDNGLWLYVNGHSMGHWGGGCHEDGCTNRDCTWSESVQPLDITSFLHIGQNLIAAHVSEYVAAEYFDAELVLSAPSDVSASDGFCDTVLITWVDESLDEDGFIILEDNQEIGRPGPDEESYFHAGTSPGAY
ncbi:MAG: hypothetical protein KKB20_30580, partial [Proteobacteria bacterium]|nr:hypothetical protein [Pseudomonadota bacterium]